jgi:hypothetical protein
MLLADHLYSLIMKSRSQPTQSSIASTTEMTMHSESTIVDVSEEEEVSSSTYEINEIVNSNVNYNDSINVITSTTSTTTTLSEMFRQRDQQIESYNNKTVQSDTVTNDSLCSANDELNEVEEKDKIHLYSAYNSRWGIEPNYTNWTDSFMG